MLCDGMVDFVCVMCVKGLIGEFLWYELMVWVVGLGIMEIWCEWLLFIVVFLLGSVVCEKVICSFECVKIVY